jgi:hypothetical protein
LQPETARSRLDVSQRSLRKRSIGRIDEHGHRGRCRRKLAQEFQPLCHQLESEEIDPCRIPARSGEARDKTGPYGIFGGDEDDWDCLGCYPNEPPRILHRLGQLWSPPRGYETA